VDDRFIFGRRSAILREEDKIMKKIIIFFIFIMSFALFASCSEPAVTEPADADNQTVSAIFNVAESDRTSRAFS
jgi:hypothetical protein